MSLLGAFSDNRFKPKEKGEIIPDNIVVYLGGSRVAFHGWEEISVKKSIDQLATQFSFTIPERFLDGTFKFSPGVRVQVNVNGQPDIVGRIEHISGKIDKDSKNMMVSGRSLTGDLVDCSVIGEMEYNNISLIDLANKLVKPFGLKADLSVTPKKIIPRVAIKPGDTVFEVLQKQARLQGFFWITKRDGNLTLTTAGNQYAKSRIEQDINMQAGSVEIDDSQRFSEYIVKGQLQGSDNYPGLISGIPVSNVKDKGVYRYRPLLIIAENSVDGELIKTRAQFEATSRLGKHIKLNCTVQGWAQENGQLWAINQIVRVKSPALGVNGDFLCVGLENKKDEGSGTITNLEFTLKDAYSVMPEVPLSSNSPLAAIVDFSKKNPASTK